MNNSTTFVVFIQFFAVNGFPCPDLQNPADHYLMTINTDFNEVR